MGDRLTTNNLVGRTITDVNVDLRDDGPLTDKLDLYVGDRVLRWVAPDTAIPPGTQALLFGLHRFTMTQATYDRLQGYDADRVLVPVIVLVWPDGSVPERPGASHG